ncbi:uncharacterized protein COLE_02544 [Cutaneotrichosporon oleaginosum]|nr:hypothetical protein COLE_02544 [Cutaneotrichosporon oleaginosum]
MRENVYQHFKFSRPITYKVVRWGLLFPAFIAAVSITYDNKFDWAGKRREDSLMAQPPTKEQAEE